jgi:hypothetical protein
MRSQIAYSAILIASLFGSPLMAAAQTFDFPTQIPGPIIRESRELQDRLQDARSGTPRSVGRTVRSYEVSRTAKPAAGGVTSNFGTKGER